MSLNEVRQEINLVDDKMKKLFDDRLCCSKKVAEVKLQEKDDVYKPLREKEICNRFAGEAWYLPYIKKVMQISRKYQYSLFIEQNNIDSKFDDFLGHNKKVILEGGIMKLSLKADKDAEVGLNIKDIISIVADTRLNITELHANSATGYIDISIEVANKDEDKQEAFLVAYMMYKETIH